MSADHGFQVEKDNSGKGVFSYLPSNPFSRAVERRECV